MRPLRWLIRLGDGIEALGSVAAFLAIVIALASAKVPHDLELWFYGLGGLALIVFLGSILWSTVRDRAKARGRQVR